MVNGHRTRRRDLCKLRGRLLGAGLISACLKGLRLIVVRVADSGPSLGIQCLLSALLLHVTSQLLELRDGCSAH